MRKFKGPLAAAPRGRGRAVCRAVCLTIGALLLLALAIALVEFAAGKSDGPYEPAMPFSRRIGPSLVVAVVGTTVWLTVRRLRTWSERPRWLLPVGAFLVLASAVVALVPFTIHPQGMPQECVPLFHAWEPTLRAPANSDMAVFTSVLVPADLNLKDPVTRRRRLEADAVTRQSPAFRRAQTYYRWTFGPGPCGRGSRESLAKSAALLIAGLGVLIGVGSAQKARI